LQQCDHDVVVGDDTVKLWDIRQFRSPLCVADNLCNLYPMYVLVDCEFYDVGSMLAKSLILPLFTVVHAGKLVNNYSFNLATEFFIPLSFYFLVLWLGTRKTVWQACKM